MMLSEHKKDQDKKKDDAHDLHDKAPPAVHGPHRGPTEHASGATAAPAMAHWADGKEGEAPLQMKMGKDPRYSESSDVVQNGTGRIIGVQIVGGRTQIMIGLGEKQGVKPGMPGYVKKGDGMLADFQIERVTDRVAYASVDVTPDMLHDHSQTVINPSAMPKSSESKADMKARLVKIDIVDNKARISIALGTSHGARPGMSGSIVGLNGGDFVIDEAHSTYSTALVPFTFDEVKGHGEVVLNHKG